LGITLQEAKNLVDAFDVDKDGVIDVKEFELMLVKNESMKQHLLSM